jgi:hypothetical protein
MRNIRIENESDMKAVFDIQTYNINVRGELRSRRREIHGQRQIREHVRHETTKTDTGHKKLKTKVCFSFFLFFVF